MPKRYHHPKTLFPSLLHGFSQVVAAEGGTTVDLSGQTAWDAQKRLAGGDGSGFPHWLRRIF